MARRRTQIDENDKAKIAVLVRKGKDILSISRQLNIDEKIVGWFSGPPRKTLRPGDKEEIIERASREISNVQIARDMNIHGHTVNGIIFNARKRNLLPPLPIKRKEDKPGSEIPPPFNAFPEVKPAVPVVHQQAQGEVASAVLQLQVQHLEERLKTKEAEATGAILLSNRLLADVYRLQTELDKRTGRNGHYGRHRRKKRS